MQASRTPSTDDDLERDAFDSLLIAVDECGRSADSDDRYYQALLTTLLREGPFSAAGFWSMEEQGATLVAVAPPMASLRPPAEDELRRLRAGHVVELPADGVAEDGNGAFGTRLLAGFAIRGAEGIALDVAVRGAGASERLRRLLEALAELAGHAETRLRFLKSARAASALASSDRLIQQFHRGDSLAGTALLVASGLQEALGYDRVWICRPRQGTAQVVATSAPGDVARRQLLVRHVEGVAAAVLDSGRELHWAVGDPAAASAQVHALAEEGLARRIVALPLVPPGQRDPVAAVVLEQFNGESPADEAVRRQTLQPHAAQALAQALAIDRQSWIGRWNAAGGANWRRRAIAGVLLLAAGFLALPVSFDVEAEGLLTPAGARSVFAPAEGVVTSLHVRHGQPVAQGAGLLDLTSPELDLERERIAAQIGELRARLAAIQVLRTQGRASSGEGDLTAQEELVQVSLRGAEEQRRLIDEQASRLAVRSPINGVVDRWDLAEALPQRPVLRGQHLCDVLDVDGAWKLELRIPDRRASVVLAAKSGGAPLSVRYVLRTAPQEEHRTRLSAVGERTEIDVTGQLVVRAVADVPAEASVPRRAGASVIARIECGRRSRAYVWFHDLWDSLALLWL